MAVIVERNPDAFVGGNADQLLRGAVLALPAASDMRQAIAPAGTSQSATRDTTNNTTYTVADGDTLYAIARRELGTAEGQLPATVTRIHALNPQAFVNDDINRLQVGAVLQLGGNANSTVANTTSALTPRTTAAAQLATPTPMPSQAPITTSAREVSKMTDQLAQAETNMATQRQIQNDLHARLTDLTESLRDSDEDAASEAVHMTNAAHAGRFAKEAAVHLAYGDLPAARHGIEEAIRLDPHRDEHKMVLVAVLEGMGEQAKARAIIDEMLTRREELRGELRSQIEQLKKMSAG